MRDLIRLIVLILLLPLLILLIGPLLVVAALRGHQQVGPITLDAARYRAGNMLALGLLLWLLIWGGLGWLAFRSTATEPTVLEAPPSATEAVESTAGDDSAVIDSSGAAASTSTLTPPATTPVAAASATPAASNTPTITRQAAAAQSSPTPNEADDAAPTSSPAVADQQAALRAIDEANDLLREAIAQGDEESMTALSRLWAGSALTSIERFARQASRRFTESVTVEYEYISAPTVSEQDEADQLVISARETWRYESPSDSEEESFSFQYTLVPMNDGWVITRYTFQNLARPTATPTSSGRN